MGPCSLQGFEHIIESRLKNSEIKKLELFFIANVFAATTRLSSSLFSGRQHV
uniref:Uncharacterized protein n=1 Tax=Anguilla anguilla TaxID=7936 RepID=A0A0E9WHW7_ANGAN